MPWCVYFDVYFSNIYVFKQSVYVMKQIISIIITKYNPTPQDSFTRCFAIF